MFRIKTPLNSYKTILKCRRVLDCHVVSVIELPRHYAAKHREPRRWTGDPRPREPCPLPPPPPKKPPKDDTLLWATVAALVISAIGMVFAKDSPQIRDWLTIYAPFVDDLIAIFYQENMTYAEFFERCVDDAKRFIENKPKPVPKDCLSVTDVAVQPPPSEEKSEEDEENCPPVEFPVVTDDICSIEACVKELGDFTINNYLTARDACIYYNKLVDDIMETEFNVVGLKKLAEAKTEREELVKVSLRNAKRAISRLDEMQRFLDCGVTAPKDEIEIVKSLVKNIREVYKARYIEYQWENDYSLAKDRLWKMVETVINDYTGQIESLFPPFKYADEKSVFEGDGDVLLYSTYRMIKHLNDNVEETAAALGERINRAYKGLDQSPEKVMMRELHVKTLYAKKLAELVKELNDRYDKQKQLNALRLEEAKKKQIEKYEANLETKLQQKEEEVMKRFNQMVEDQVAAEKRGFKAQLQDMAMKLEILEDKLNARLKAERETRRSQELWAAGSALLAATKKRGPRVSVCKELNAVEKAAGDDKLVQTVLKSIPACVREHGVSPETTLKENYKLMEDAALKIALVEEDGALMPVYILSWIQALFLFMKVPGIPQKEFDHPPKVPSKDLDTFDLLQRARFWVNRGNMAQALPYVDHLKGASRLAAHTWYQSARAHVEVRQAAEAILAHAAALGLQYL